MGRITPLSIEAWAWLALALLWLVAGRFVAPAKSSESRWRRYQHIFPMYLGFFLIFYHRHWFAVHEKLYESDAVAWIGVVITLIGICFAAWARLSLGRNWSGIITLKQGHRLITSGPYRFARHPIYTGFLTAGLGCALTAATADAFVGLAILTAALVLKLRREETVLTTEFGDEYVRFKQNVAALVPFFY